MHWYNFPPLLIDTAIAAALGYGCIIAVALLKVRRGHRATFIKENGTTLTTCALSGIFGTPLVALFIWAPLFFVLTSFFGYSNTESHRLLLFVVICIAVFVASMCYVVYEMIKNYKASGSSS